MSLLSDLVNVNNAAIAQGWAGIAQAAFALILIIVGGIQVAVYRQQTRIMKSMREAAHKQTEIMDRQAGLAEKQVLLTGRQIDLTGRQHELQQVQFYAQHRPQLVLKDVYFLAEHDMSDLAFEISNIGGSDAKIIDASVKIDFIADPSLFRVFVGDSISCHLDGARFGAGELRQFSAQVPSEVSFHLRFPDAGRIRSLDNPRPSRGDLFFVGILYYVDGRGETSGTKRSSVFRRKWDAESRSFRRTENPDHEYSD